jgi:hypothetical protein
MAKSANNNWGTKILHPVNPQLKIFGSITSPDCKAIVRCRAMAHKINQFKT